MSVSYEGFYLCSILIKLHNKKLEENEIVIYTYTILCPECMTYGLLTASAADRRDTWSHPELDECDFCGTSIMTTALIVRSDYRTV